MNRLGRNVSEFSKSWRSLSLWGYLGIAAILATTFHPRSEGDTQALVRGADRVLACFAMKPVPMPCGPAVDTFPVFQYIFALPLKLAGLGSESAITILAILSLAWFLASIAAFWRAGSLVAGTPGAHLAVLVPLSGYAIYYLSSSYNESAAFALFSLLALSIIDRWKLRYVFLLAFACTITKEVAFPFVAYFMVVSFFARESITAQRLPAPRDILSFLYEYRLSLVSIGLGVTTNIAFNYFRYGGAGNVVNLDNMYWTPWTYVPRFLIALFASPAGGLLFTWFSLCCLLLAAFGASTVTHAHRWVVALLILGLLAYNVGLARWYSPFGWYAWGPRLTLPILGSVGVLSVYLLASPVTQLLRSIGRTKGFVILAGIVVASSLPNLAVRLDPDALFTKMFAPSQVQIDSGISNFTIQSAPTDLYMAASSESLSRNIVLPTASGISFHHWPVAGLWILSICLVAWHILSRSNATEHTEVAAYPNRMQALRRWISTLPALTGVWQYFLAALVASVFTAITFHLGQVSLQIPFVYTGDAPAVTANIKTILETGWAFTNPSLGAPFGAVFYDYPSSDSLHYLVIRLFALFTRNPVVIYNLYYLLSFPLAALTSLFALKRLGAPFYIALPGAIAFAFLPFHLLRYEHFYFSLYYMVPLGLLMVLQAGTDEFSMVAWDPERRRTVLRTRHRGFWFCLVLCILTASTGIYYAYFIACVGLALAARAFLLRQTKQDLARALSTIAIVAVLLFTVEINAAPSPIYTMLRGAPSTPVVFRPPGGAEIYGLKLIQLVLPSPIHRITQLAAITQRYDATAPLVNENVTSSLGLLGVIGLLFSVLSLVLRRSEDTLLERLGFVDFFCVILATVGGVGSMISYAILPQIRGYNRISVVIGFISIAAACILLERLSSAISSRWPRILPNWARSTTVCLSLLAVVFVDQCYLPNFLENNQLTATAFRNDEIFAQKIERRLPPGSMIFELPFMRYPENGPINHMNDYDQLKPYIHSSGLRWSYGGTKGRPSSDWGESTAALPVRRMLQRLVAAGFSAIYIDRFGYADGGAQIEASIQAYVDRKPIISRDKRFALYDIRPLPAAASYNLGLHLGSP